jgi:hypothetical protein
MGIRGVVGAGIGVDDQDRPLVKILTEHADVTGIPKKLDDVTVEVEVTGEFYALPKYNKPVPVPVNPKSWFTRPVPIGVSTGNEGECSAGTIGCRVRNGGNVYALSNNHVYALENKAAIGSKVLQPGLYDSRCLFNETNVFGTLSKFVPIDFSANARNEVDAAIALSSPANLGNATPSNGYGVPKSTTIAPAVRQAVQKYGRTTSLTKGTITAINATVKVSYSSGTANFVNQIIVQTRTPFIGSGDSGSLLVTDPGANPVGLLFAGNTNGTYSVANTIDAVLGALGVSIDGK